MLQIAFDVDGVLANLVDRMLEIYNNERGANLKYSDITDFHFQKCLPEHSAGLYEVFQREGFFLDLPVLPGSQEVVRKLLEWGHRIEICTAPPTMRKPCGGRFVSHYAAAEKIQWLQKHFPELGHNVTITTNKHLVKADILVDDALHNIEAWTKEHSGLGFIVEQPWNAGKPLPTNAQRGTLQELLPLIQRMDQIVGIKS